VSWARDLRRLLTWRPTARSGARFAPAPERAGGLLGASPAPSCGAAAGPQGPADQRGQLVRPAAAMSGSTPKRTPSVKQLCALPTLDPPCPPNLTTSRTSKPAKVLLRAVQWAREELNLRPLPCQIPWSIPQKNSEALRTVRFVEKLEVGGLPLGGSPVMVHHHLTACLRVPTGASCCPSAACVGGHAAP
jgi:hypothetical protein